MGTPLRAASAEATASAYSAFAFSNAILYPEESISAKVAPASTFRLSSTLTRVTYPPTLALTVLMWPSTWASSVDTHGLYRNQYTAIAATRTATRSQMEVPERKHGVKVSPPRGHHGLRHDPDDVVPGSGSSPPGCIVSFFAFLSHSLIPPFPVPSLPGVPRLPPH